MELRRQKTMDWFVKRGQNFSIRDIFRNFVNVWVSKRVVLPICLFLNISCFGDVWNSSSDKYNDTTNHGSIFYGKEVVDSIKGQGSVSLQGTTVLNTVDVQGEITINDSKLNTLQAVGQITVRNSTIAGDSKIQGSLNAFNAYFGGNITLATNESIFENSHAPLVTIEPTRNKIGQKIVVINSKIGRVIFQEEGGKVILQGKSSIQSVKGGVVVNE